MTDHDDLNEALGAIDRSIDAEMDADAALEAAAALRQPREGAGGRYREALERIVKIPGNRGDYAIEIATAALSEEAENG